MYFSLAPRIPQMQRPTFGTQPQAAAPLDAMAVSEVCGEDVQRPLAGPITMRLGSGPRHRNLMRSGRSESRVYEVRGPCQRTETLHGAHPPGRRSGCLSDPRPWADEF